MDSAFFAYGNKTKEFLIKRSIYLIEYLKMKCDVIILACNTLSIVVLPFLRLIYDNVYGIFDEFIPYLNSNGALIGSYNTVSYLSNKYSSILFIDGSSLISRIEKDLDIEDEINSINELIKNKDYLILACTHFLRLKDEKFITKVIKNSKIPF